MPVFNKLIYNGTEYDLWGWGWNVWEPTDLSAVANWTVATITWTDKNLDSIPATSFQKSVLVRKIGSAPTTPTDWTTIVEETVQNTYQTNWYADTWLTKWTDYYYRVFSYSTSWYITCWIATQIIWE